MSVKQRIIGGFALGLVTAVLFLVAGAYVASYGAWVLSPMALGGCFFWLLHWFVSLFDAGDEEQAREQAQRL